MLSKTAHTWYLSVLAAAAITAPTGCAWTTTPTNAIHPYHHSSYSSSRSSRSRRGLLFLPQQHQQQPDLCVSLVRSSSSRSNDNEQHDDEPLPSQQQQHHTLVNQTRTTHATGSMGTSTRGTGIPSLGSNNNDDQKKIRVAKAQAEIDRILSLPDTFVFDAEAELTKVIAMAPRGSSSTEEEDTNTTTMRIIHQENNDSDNNFRGTDRLPVEATTTTLSGMTLVNPGLTDALVGGNHNNNIDHLESALVQAVQRQDFDAAANHRIALDQLHMDDSLAVLQVNAAFYKAFSKKDVRLMESVWMLQDNANSNSVTVIHPSNPPIVGAAAVADSWQRMFDSSNGSFQRNWMEPCNIRLAVQGGGSSEGAMAIVTCDERVYVRRFVRGQRRQTELVNVLTATNVFRKVRGKWHMVHHHASWHADSEAAKNALHQQKEGGQGNPVAPSSSSSSSAYIASLQKRQQAYDEQQKQQQNDGLNMDGILGIPHFGPLLGDSKNKGALSSSSSSSSNTPPPRRIIMGSLSDILNGSLGDLLSDTDKKDTASDDNNNKNSDAANAFIQFQIQSESEDDDLDDDDDIDDLDDDDNEDDDDDYSGDAAVSEDGKDALAIVKEWVDSRGKSARDEKETSKQLQSSSRSASSTTTATRTTVSIENALRQKCITSLRHLCNQGLLSSRQKRVLLTDIISCAAKGEKSMIEVAHELLVVMQEHDDDDGAATAATTATKMTLNQNNATAQEEFADQCRLLADSMMTVEL